MSAVRPGQAVKGGDVLFILEAMKMENEICAPHDGTVASVNVQKGAACGNRYDPVHHVIGGARYAVFLY